MHFHVPTTTSYTIEIMPVLFEAPFLRPSPDIPAPNARCQSCVSVPTLASAPLTLHTQRFQAAPSVCQPLSTLFHSRVFYSIAVPPSSSRLLSWLSLSLYQFLSAQGNCADVLLVVGWIGQDQWFSTGAILTPRDICLETVLVVYNWGGGSYWHLLGRCQGCC